MRRQVTGSSGEKGKAIILVVDRDPHICELESHFLHEAGYSVEFKMDGEGALEQVRKIIPDIIITEILVPTLDGLALCRKIKADPRTRDTAVLVFSILAAAGRAREAGADAFLRKPLAEHTLVETVRQVLEARHTRMMSAMQMNQENPT
jgi:CheY-like chemotaxis protein